jgi:group I intron endonuclease
MPFGYIYKIEFPNGKHYIGLTSRSLEQREREHKCCAQTGDERWLYNAIRKYGMADTLELIEIDTAGTKDELCKKEIGYILKYNSYYMNGNGYNMTLGGDGLNGYVFTEEDKKKISESAKKQFETPEARQKHSEILIQFNKHHPEAGKEHSERLKQLHKDHPEIGEKHSERMMQLLTTEDAREKCVAPLKQFHRDNPHASKEQGERRTQYNKDHPEVGIEQGEKLKKYYDNNPGARQKASETQKARSPEWKQKKSDAQGLNKPFDIFKDGIFIKTFNYQFEAKEYLQKEHHIASTIKISEVLTGNRNNSAGFVFKYK